MHPHLPLVIDRTTRIDIPIPLRRLKRRRLPLIQRLGRLHIIVPIAKHRRLRLSVSRRRCMQPIRIHQRMPIRMLRRSRLDQPNILHPDPFQLRRHKLSRPSNIPHPLRIGRYRRNPQQCLQLLDKPPFVLLRKLDCRHHLRCHDPLSERILPPRQTRCQSETQVYENFRPPHPARHSIHSYRRRLFLLPVASNP